MVVLLLAGHATDAHAVTIPITSNHWQFLYFLLMVSCGNTTAASFQRQICLMIANASRFVLLTFTTEAWNSQDHSNEGKSELYDTQVSSAQG